MINTKGRTPGQWLAGCDAPKRPSGFGIDDVYSEAGAAVCKMTGDIGRSYKDARIIAAAPDLLAACRLALYYFSETRSGREWIDNGGQEVVALRDAIGKAEGRWRETSSFDDVEECITDTTNEGGE